MLMTSPLFSHVFEESELLTIVCLTKQGELSLGIILQAADFNHLFVKVAFKYLQVFEGTSCVPLEDTEHILSWGVRSQRPGACLLQCCCWRRGLQFRSVLLFSCNFLLGILPMHLECMFSLKLSHCLRLHSGSLSSCIHCYVRLVVPS